jgi:hypothetical protein
MIKAHTTTKDSGPKKAQDLVKELKKLKTAFVSIGVHEGGKAYKTGESVVSVALWNEFGTERIPQRSFIRSTVDEHAPEINEWRAQAIEKIMAGRSTVDHELNAIGNRIQLLIQNKINSNVPPPNAASTRARKKRNKVAPRTLVDTGVLYESITYKVHG